MDGLAIAKFGVIYSQLVYMKTKAGDVQGAMAYVEKAKERGLDYPNLWGVALHDLEQKLLAENQNVPWEVSPTQIYCLQGCQSSIEIWKFTIFAPKY